NKFANWARLNSVLPPVKIPSAERRVYRTSVAPPTGKPGAANLPTFGIEAMRVQQALLLPVSQISFAQP
ncbi:MAG TPA: hypothetical protein PLR25_27600, partial [Planctomycetaceae bacterium]|nr:hypothetical protein [Planctomycetaceae bacterium]